MEQYNIEGKWREVKSDVKKAFGRLTDDELEKTKGDFNAVSSLIQQRYGEAQDAVSKKLEGIYERFMEKGEEEAKH